MKTKNSFSWIRNFSAGGSIEVPAGVPVEYHAKNKCYYVNPMSFNDCILQHDAIHYGCRVEPSNIDGEGTCAGCTHLTPEPRLHCLKTGYCITGTLEQIELCKANNLYQAREAL